MKTVKKLLSVLICLTLILSCILVQAEETVIKDYNPEHLKVLNALGITDYSDEDLVSTITRGEFYEILCKAAGYPATENATQVFADLKPGDEGETYAKTLYKVGIIAPDKNGNVYPGAIMTASEAVALVMKVLGYGPMADAKGGYPTGYLAVAKSADVTDGLTLQGTFLKADACHLLYNALYADMMVPVYSKGNKPIEHKVEEGTNLLNTSLGIEVQEGVVEGIDVSRLTGLNDVYPFCVEVNGVQIDVEYIPDAHSFLGYAVKAYYTAGRNKLNKMLFIEKTEDNNEVVIDIEDISTVANTSLKAYMSENSSKVKTFKIKKAAPVIYNGVSTDQAFTEELLSGKLGNVKLLDNTGDGTYDVVFVNAYENFVVSHYDNDNKMIYHKYDSSQKISVDNTIDEPYVILYDETGVEINPSKLKKGNVLTVYESAPDAYQKYIRAYLSTVVVTGTVDSIEDDESIFINDTEYELDKVNKSKYKQYIGVGADVKAYLDINGKIADIMPDESTSFKYGFLVAAGSEGTMDSVTKFKFYTLDGEFILADAAKNVSIDGVKYKNTDELLYNNLYAAAKQMYGNKVEPDCVNSVVRYALNSSGQVVAIDTVMYDESNVATRLSNHTDKNSFFAVSVNDKYESIDGHVRVGSKIAFENTSMRVVVCPDAQSEPESVFDEESYEISTISQTFLNTSTVSVSAFYTYRKQTSPEFLVTISSAGGSGIGASSRLAIIDKVTKAIGEDGMEEVDCIHLVNTNSGELKATVKEGLTVKGDTSLNDPDLAYAEIPVSSLKNGDVVRYVQDQHGVIKRLDLVYRPSTNTKNTKLSLTNGSYANYWDYSFVSEISIRIGYVYETTEKGFYLYFSDSLTGNAEKDSDILEDVSIDDCWFIYTAGNSARFYRYDMTLPENLRISSTTAASLEDYTHTGTDASYVIVYLYHGAPYSVIEFVGIE